jgi:iron complex transport system substrate-binding protein
MLNALHKPGRMIISWLVLAMLICVLAACGANTNKPAATPQETNAINGNEQATNTTAGEEQETRTITDDLDREVAIPVAPQRVIVSDFSSELLAVGVSPIAVGNNDHKIIYTQNLLSTAESIGDPPSVEKILDLQPDLIIMSTVMNQIYPEIVEQIEKIAPLVYISFDQDPIYDIFPKVADLVGKSEEAKQWIADYEQEAQVAREQVKAAIGDEAVSIFRIEKGRLRIYLNRNFAGYMLNSGLKVNTPEAVAAEIAKNKFASAVEISLEKLPDYAADHMFLIVRDSADDQGAYEEIQKSALWKSLPAVQNGNVHLLDTDKYYGSDIMTIRETMKEAAAMLVK